MNVANLAESLSKATGSLRDQLMPPNFHLPLVSVVVVNHNYGRYLEEAVESVFAQTYTNVECIIVDNASTDETPAVLATLLERYPQIEIVRRAANEGQTVATLDGFKVSRRTICDLPRCRRRLAAALHRNPYLCASFLAISRRFHRRRHAASLQWRDHRRHRRGDEWLYPQRTWPAVEHVAAVSGRARLAAGAYRRKSECQSALCAALEHKMDLDADIRPLLSARCAFAVCG